MIHLRRGKAASGRHAAMRWAVALFVLCVVGSIIAALSYAVSQAHRDEELLATRAEAMSANLAVMIHDAGAHASAVTALFHASVHVTEQEFSSFVEDIGLTEGMFGMGFVAAVDQPEIAGFELELARNHPGAFVFEVDEGEPVAVGLRDTYHPIQFWWSVDDLPAWGFDAGSDPEFAAAIERTLKTGRLSASGFLVFPVSAKEGWVISQPVFRADGTVRGVVATAMDIDAVLAAALLPGVEDELELRIHDLTGGAPRTPEGAWSESVRAANRTWRIDVVSTGGSPNLWTVMLIISVGIAMGAALAAAVLAVSARLRQQSEVDKMRSLNRQKDDFLATVSHELRTPLTSIVGFADALREGSGELSRADQVEMIDFIADEADAMEGIVQDLLVVARLQQHGVVPITCRAIDNLAAEVKKIADQAAIVRSSPTTVSGNASAFADPARLRQILRNLFDNSVRHGLPPIEVTIEADGVQVRVRVQDSGPGVGVAEVPKLFDRYRSGPNPEGLPTSTGIGLWLSRELARLMGGDLRLVGTGKGAAFELTLPVTGGGECVIEPSALAEQAVGF
ncbi:MAG: ATP-binding protein [Acidimicrobiia bacterium]